MPTGCPEMPATWCETGETMAVHIVDRDPEALEEYAGIPIRFEVTSVLQVQEASPPDLGFTLTEKPVESWTKDYDVDDRPMRWRRRWDMSNWGFFLALDGDTAVGGCVVAWKTEGVHRLLGRDDIAALWDIRVHPEHRRKGVGKALFARAAAYGRERDCLYLRIETQNINVSACRFYESQGAVLGGVDRFAYSDYPDEVSMDWYLDLTSSHSGT